MQVTPFGASRTVTGSCHLVQEGGTRILLDCGMYQGSEEDRNADRFGFDPRSLDAVVISHAHLDHIGRLPRLVREGAKCPVYMTDATATLLPIMLEDALHVMEYDRERAKRHGHPPPQPLWTWRDLQSLMKRIETMPYHQDRSIGSLTVRLHDAGHLPGSAFVEVRDGGRTLLFSGDLGHPGKHVLPAPDTAPRADLVLCEATYGDRPHRSFAATLAEFEQVLSEVLGDGGQVVIPSFALERTQELLFHIRVLEEQGRIPSVPVFLDSPLAIRVTSAFGSLAGSFTDDVRTVREAGGDPFSPADLRCTATVEASKAIAEHHGPAIVIAGSGMLSGGRVLHHLKRMLPESRHCLMIVGYQPRGGLGRRLIDGDYPVRIYGTRVPVYARIETINGFSAHAGQDHLLSWLEGQERVALVHGEPEAIDTLEASLRERGQSVVEARWGEPMVV